MDQSSGDISAPVSEAARGSDTGQSPGLQSEFLKKAISTSDMLLLTPIGQGSSVDRKWVFALTTSYGNCLPGTSPTSDLNLATSP